MTRRTGATLVEVLVTIFVMALGLMALLTLFPLGALSMAQAIKDSRSALAAANAEALAIARNIRNEAEIVSVRPEPYYQRSGTPSAESWFPRYQVGSPPVTYYPLDALPDGPSYPVFVDGIGWNSYRASPDAMRWVGGDRGGIPRRGTSFTNGSTAATYASTLRNFCLLDDITFGKEGVPIGPNGQPSRPAPGPNPVQREGRYSWAYLVRRPRTSTPSVVDLTVVVYSQRPLQAANPLQPSGENVYDATRVPGMTNVIQLSWGAGQEKPPVRKGSWILDVSRRSRMVGTGLRDRSPLAANPDDVKYFKKYGPVNGYFYRVVSVRDVSANLMELEVNQDINKRAPIEIPNDPTPVDPTPLGNKGRIIVMEQVVEVFEKGPGWLP